jgi:hypothetical protein
VLFELSHENIGLETLHFYKEAKKFKVGLFFPNYPSKASFKQSKGSSESLQTSIVFRMFQRACLGRLARALAYLSF